MKTLLIVGAGRSGTTITGNLLGSVPGLRHVGELHQLWIRGLRDAWPCSCGSPVMDCRFWAPALREAFGEHWPHQDYGQIDEKRLEAYRQLISEGACEQNSAAGSYLESLLQLRVGIETVHGPAVLVDSSKHPAHAMLLSAVLGESLYVLHLVRDARAVARSWQRMRVRTDAPAGETMYRADLGASCDAWLNRNRAAERICAYLGRRAMRMRYEDFAAKPDERLRELLAFVGESDRELPAMRQGSVELVRSHSISGNPARGRHVGWTLIGVDDAWKREMHADDRDEVTCRTWPWLVRYGYERVGSTSANSPDESCDTGGRGGSAIGDMEGPAR